MPHPTLAPFSHFQTQPFSSWVLVLSLCSSSTGLLQERVPRYFCSVLYCPFLFKNPYLWKYCICLLFPPLTLSILPPPPTPGLYYPIVCVYGLGIYAQYCPLSTSLIAMPNKNGQVSLILYKHSPLTVSFSLLPQYFLALPRWESSKDASYLTSLLCMLHFSWLSLSLSSLYQVLFNILKIKLQFLVREHFSNLSL